MTDEVALRLDWADFEPTDDRQAMALALLTAGIVVDTDAEGKELPGDLVRLNFDLADIVLDALASTGRRLVLAPLASVCQEHGCASLEMYGDEPRDPTARMLVAWRDIAEPLPEKDRLDTLARFLRVVIDHGRAWIWPVR